MSTSAETRLRWLLLASAALTLLCAVAFPLAPVHQPVVRFAYTGGPAVALPLMPYQPVALDASVSCAALRATPPGTATLATTPPGTPPAPVGGLTVRPDGLVTSNGIVLARAPLPPGDCTLAVSSRPEHTEVRLDGQVVAAQDADVRPVMAAIVPGAPSGLALSLQTDTRFQTTPSALKVVLAVGCLLGLAGLVTGAVLADGRRVRCVRPRPGVVDVVVTLGLAAWAVVGPATIDDGYIAGILRARDDSGFIGNVYRWLNAPEAPFSWFYELVRGWAALAPGEAASVLWLRVPATVLGLLTWALLRRHGLPRLGPALRRPGAVWIAAAVFAAWWAPFGLSLRPEPWVALGVLAVWVATERAIATRALLPLVVAGTVAGLTVALTPGALSGLAPLLVGVGALVRHGVPRREALRRVLVVGAALSVAVLPMAADQSLAGLLEATRVRQVIGGGQPWWDELSRYVQLVTPGSIQGGLGARLPVLLLLGALPAVAWMLRGAGARIGIAPSVAGRLVAVVALSLALLALSPTKWTLHFGEFMGLGTLLITAFVLLWAPPVLGAFDRARGPAFVVGVGALGLVATLVLLGDNQWAFASAWGVFWNDIPPQVLRVPLADVLLPVTIGGTVVLGVLVAIRGQAPTAVVRALAPGRLALVLVVAVVALEGLSFVKVTADRAGTFSYGSDGLAALRGQDCGLARDLTVEPDPAAGLLPAGPPTVERADFLSLDASRDAPLTPEFAPTTTAPPAVPLRIAGEDLPGWSAPVGAAGTSAATLRSGWFALPDSARDREAPVVVTVSGTLARGSVVLEFAASPTDVPTIVGPGGPTTGIAARDLRALAPEGTTLVRVVATDAARTAADSLNATITGVPADVPLAVSIPRVPRTVPFGDVVPPGSTALVDWPVAFVFPCLRLPALTSGTAGIPPWRIATPGLSDAGEIAVAPTTGGPFLTPRLLVDEVRVPVYLVGDPTRDAVGLARWTPRLPLSTLAPQVTDETVAGWAKTGRASVPVLDTP